MLLVSNQKTKQQMGICVPEGSIVMNHDTTKENLRQVKNAPLIDIEGSSVYFQQHGEYFAQLTYLGKKPKKGISTVGRVTERTSKDIAAIRRAVGKLKGIIRANFGQDVTREAHLTLTYRGSMTCTEKLQEGLEKFIKQLRYNYPHHKFEYLAVMEPHGHGGWHIHMLLKSDKPLWFDSGGDLSFKDTLRMWRKANGTGEGAVRHEKFPDDVKDFGLYFAAYFTTAIPEAIELSGDREAIKTASKAAQKGSRLHFYPANFKFYRASRGIYRPKTVEIFCDEKVMSDYEPFNAIAFEVVNVTDEKTLQFIQKMELRKRTKLQN